MPQAPGHMASTVTAIILKQGTLLKKGGESSSHTASWVERWFVLDTDGLHFYTTNPQYAGAKKLGHVLLPKPTQGAKNLAKPSRSQRADSISEFDISLPTMISLRVPRVRSDDITQSRRDLWVAWLRAWPGWLVY